MASDYRLISPATGKTLYLVNSTGSAPGRWQPVRAQSPRPSAFGPTGRPTPAAKRISGRRAAGERRPPPLSRTATATRRCRWRFQGTSARARAGRCAGCCGGSSPPCSPGRACSTPAPDGASEPTYFEIESAHLVERGFSGTETSPGEGAVNLLIDLTVVRQPYGGAATRHAAQRRQRGNKGTARPTMIYCWKRT